MLTSFRRTAHQTKTAWTAALPFHILCGLAMTLGFALHGPATGASAEAGILLVALCLAAGLLSWAYAGQSVREDFTRLRGVRRFPALLWRCALAFLLSTLVLGSPVVQAAIGPTSSTRTISLVFMLAAGLLSLGIFVFLEWCARVGTPRPHAPEPALHPTAVARAVGRGWWNDIKAGTQLVRHVWKRIIPALFALTLSLSLISIGLQIALSLALLPVLRLTGLDTAPSAFSALALLVTVPLFAICPTAAAVALHRRPQAPAPGAPSGTQPDAHTQTAPDIQGRGTHQGAKHDGDEHSGAP